jgi:hypothetical protein
VNPLPQQSTVEYRTCKTCGLSAPVGQHGAVHCIDNLKARVQRLHRECIMANARATAAEEQLAEIRKVLADG